MDRVQTASRQYLLGSLMVLLGALGFSTKAVLVKLAYSYSALLDASMLMALRMLFSLPFFLAVALWLRQRRGVSPPAFRDMGAIALLGVMGFYVAGYLDFAGLAYIPAGLERLILFLYPTLVVMLAAVFYRSPITMRIGAALALSYFGTAVVFFQPLPVAPPQLSLGALLVFGSALVFALYTLLSGVQMRRSGSVVFTAYAMTAASLAAVAHYVIGHGTALPDLPPQVYALAALMALLSTVLPAFLMHAGIHRIGAGQASMIGSIGPVMTLYLAWVFLEEQVGMIQLMGTAMIIAGVLLISRGAGQTRKTEEGR